MRICMVLFYKSRDTMEGVSFFYLTKKRYTIWMIALGRDLNIEKLSGRNVVCSKHFTDDDFLHVKGKKRHKPNAVPSLNVGPRKPLFSQTNLIQHHCQKSNLNMPTTSSGYDQIPSVEYKENIPEDMPMNST
ncbi:uncharacterized protein [Leptinotarsa decemlineata]|uniref:uncharacterized protein n=1 Tax=Leptinotarsa decemlineata TaxID=7539 RepID=UPI003D3045D0